MLSFQRFCLYLALSVLLIISDDIYFSLFSSIIITSILLFKKKRRRKAIYRIAVLMSFVVLGSISLLFSISPEAGSNISQIGSTSFYFNHSNIPLMLFILAKSFSLISLFSLLYFTTKISDWSKFMKCVYIPSYIIDIVFLTYRYIFILKDNIQQIKQSQQGRLGYHSKRATYHSVGLMLVSIIRSSVANNQEYYQALQSRCYNDTIIFLSPEDEKQNPAGWWLVITIFLVALLIYICTELII